MRSASSTMCSGSLLASVLTLWASFCFVWLSEYSVTGALIGQFWNRERDGGLGLRRDLTYNFLKYGRHVPQNVISQLPVSFAQGPGANTADQVSGGHPGSSAGPDVTRQDGRPARTKGNMGGLGERQFPSTVSPRLRRGARSLAYREQQRQTAARRRKVQQAINAMKARRAKAEALAGTTVERTPGASGEPEPSWETSGQTSGGLPEAAGPSWVTPGMQYSSERSAEVVTGQEAALEEAIYSVLRRAAAWVYSQPSVFAEDEAVQAFTSILGPNETFKVRLSSPVRAERQFMRGRILGAGGAGIVIECWDTMSGALYACKIPWVKPVPGRLTPERVTWGLGRSREEETSISSLLGPNLTPEILRDAYGLFVPWFAGSIVEISGAPYYNYVLSSAHSRPFYNLVVGFWPAAGALIDVASTNFLPLGVTLFIVRQVIRTVAGLHSLGVVHADIKVENFLVGHNGGIYLGDFGTVTPVAGRQRFRPPGTIAYLDPQSAAEALAAGPLRGESATIPRDTWALGVTVYLLLCHRMPFEIEETGSRETTLRSIIEEARRQKTLSFDVCLLPEDHPAAPELQAIINHMLARKPEARTPPQELVRQFPFLNLPLVAWAEKFKLLFTDSSVTPARGTFAETKTA